LISSKYHYDSQNEITILGETGNLQ